MSSPQASRIRARLAVIPRALAVLARSAGRRTCPAHPGRILIAHHLLLGDTLMLTPLLAKLRERFPEADVVMTATPPLAPLYASRPYGVRAIAYEPRAAESLGLLFAQAGFDLAVVPGDNRYSWLAAALGSRWIVAFGNDRPAYKSWPVDQLRPYPGVPAAWGDMVAGLLDGPGPRAYRPVDWPDPPHGPFDPPRDHYCVLHVGASSPLKLWGPEKWRALAQGLCERGLQVVWSGGRGEDGIVRSIDPEHRFRSYAGLLELPQVWQLLKRARLLVCPDTGIAHLGRVVGVPTVTLFGPGSAVLCGAGDFWRDAPYRALTVENFPCRDQNVLFKRRIGWVRRCARTPDQCRQPACMEAVTIDGVLGACDGLIAGAR